MTSLRSSLSFFACFSSAYLVLGCGNTGTGAQDYGNVLQYLTEQVILPEHQDFVTQASALVVATQALSDKPSAKTLAAAQAAWRKTRKAWRMLDAVQIKLDLKNHIAERIDVSPVDAVGIEAIVTGTGALNDDTVSVAGGKKKGFLGLEYILFPDPSAAADTSAPALAGDDAAARRRTLAVSMADEIASSAKELDDAWEGSGNYAQQVEQAGAGSTQYATQRAAVDDLVSGGVAGALELIVYVRLALPLGRKNGGTPDPTQDLTSRSDSAVADMQATLAGLVAVYSGQGFSAVIRSKSTKLDDTVISEISDAEHAIAAIPAPFADSLVVADPAKNKVQLAYTATQALKQTWNTDVSSALGATLKPSDPDGD